MSRTAAFYKTKALPSSVTHAVKCHFTGEDDENLVLVKNDVLEVYKLLIPPEANQENGRKRKRKREVSCKLFLHCQHQLYGVVEDIKPAIFLPNRTDSLILSFSRAKFSVIHFDHSLNDIITTALYPFEAKGLNTTDYVDINHIPIIRVDPENRCAGFLISQRHICIIPLVVSAQTLSTDPPELDTEMEPELVEFEHYQINNVPKKSRYLDHFIIDLYTNGVKDLVDFVFLHGYHSPTLLMLHHVDQTWAGRLSVKKNTGALITISVNIPGKSWDEVCNQRDLPWNTYKLESLKNPIGGALVFSPDAILHFSQNVDYGLSLNQYGDELNSVEIPLTKFESAGQNVISLEDVHCCSLADDRLMIGDSTAKLYLLSFQERSMELKMEARSSAPSCLVPLAKEYIFIGSGRGDSLLVKYRAKETEIIVPKRRKVEKEAPPSPETVPLFRNDDADYKVLFTEGGEDGEKEKVEKIGSDEEEEEKTLSVVYSYEIHDSLVNTAPIVHFDTSPAVRALDDDEAPDEDDELNRDRVDFIMCTGMSKNGALVTIHEGVRPEVLEFLDELSPSNGAWTLYPSHARALADPDYHLFLLISHEKQTRPLTTEDEIKTCNTETDFFTKGSTLAAGNIMDREYMIQVHAGGLLVLSSALLVREVDVSELRKLAGVKEHEDDPLGIGHHIVEAHVLDPFVAIRLSDGSVVIFSVSLTSNTSNIDVALGVSPPEKKSIEVKAVAIHGDDKKKQVSCIGLFNALAGSPLSRVIDFKPGDKLPIKPSSAPKPEDLVREEEQRADAHLEDDEMLEEMLFGDEKNDEPIVKETSPKGVGDQVDKEEEKIEESCMRHMLTLALTNGVVEIYVLPALTLVFRSHGLSQGYKTLTNLKCERELEDTLGGLQKLESPSMIVELKVCTLSPGRLRTYLFAFLDTGDLMIYEVFSFDAPREYSLEVKVTSYTPIRLSRIPHRLITRPFTAEDDLGQRNGQGPKENWNGGPRIIPFKNVAGRSGIFLGGNCPAWVFGHRDFVRIHPMAMAGEHRGVSTLTELHNVNCNWGVVYFDTSPGGCLFVGTLSEQRTSNSPLDSYDAEIPYSRTMLKQTPRFIARHSTTNTLLVVVSKPKEIMGQEMPTERSLPVFDLKFEARLYDPKTWEICESYDNFNLLQDDNSLNERILCLKEVWLEVPLKTGGTVTRNYLAMGTGTNEGEEQSCEGKVLLFEVFKSQQAKFLDSANAAKGFRLKCTYSRAERGPVTAVGACKGLLCMCIGAKVLLYKWNGSQLIGCAFYTAKAYCVDCVSIKNYILLSDVFHSIFVVLWEEETSRIIYLGRDEAILEVLKAEFLVDGENLNFLVSDQRANLQLFNYSPTRIGSRGGKKLLLNSSIHTGRQFHHIIRLRSRKLPSTAWELNPYKDYDPDMVPNEQVSKYFCLLGGKNGSLSTLSPVAEVVYRRLSTLTFQMMFKTRQLLGLNPREFRTFKAPGQHRSRELKKGSIVDGDFLCQTFLNLDFPSQKKLATTIGTSPDVVINNIQRILMRTSLF